MLKEYKQKWEDIFESNPTNESMVKIFYSTGTLQGFGIFIGLLLIGVLVLDMFFKGAVFYMPIILIICIFATVVILLEIIYPTILHVLYKRKQK